MVTTVGLPLLIVNGKFQSLSSMKVEDLETFIPFLVKCSVNKAGAQLVNGIPEWWSSVIQYKFPLRKPNGLSQVGYRRHLSSIVCRCYWYHDAQYLLPFCAKIADNPDSIFLRNNEDNTTSIYYVHNIFHVMKFNNENKDYDMKPKKWGRILRRRLLPPVAKKAASIPDIYLCENCDAEFSSHTEMQKHEKECYEVVKEDERVKGVKDYDSSEEIEVLEHFKPKPTSEKTTLFDYLQLHSNNVFGQSNTTNAPECCGKKTVAESHSKRWVSVDLCIFKNPSIEFSSPLGKKILDNCARYKIIRDSRTKPDRTSILDESNCQRSSSVKSGRDFKETTEFRVTYRKSKRTRWTHQYCFSKKQRRSRYNTLKTGKT